MLGNISIWEVLLVCISLLFVSPEDIKAALRFIYKIYFNARSYLNGIKDSVEVSIFMEEDKSKVVKAQKIVNHDYQSLSIDEGPKKPQQKSSHASIPSEGKLLFVFLNNFENCYNDTPHNVALYYMDTIIERYCKGQSLTKFSKNSNIIQSKILNREVIMLKPLTYMNLSGISVSEVCSFFKIKKSNTIVFHDDMDLSEDDIRIKFGGSSAGHNGIKSIDLEISNQYNRVRVGVGKPLVKNDDGSINNIASKNLVRNFITKKMDHAWVENQKSKAVTFVDNLESFLSKNFDEFLRVIKSK
jgi:PTH1 family peptidyl-tRNA hydrolase